LRSRLSLHRPRLSASHSSHDNRKQLLPAPFSKAVYEFVALLSQPTDIEACKAITLHLQAIPKFKARIGGTQLGQAHLLPHTLLGPNIDFHCYDVDSRATPDGGIVCFSRHSYGITVAGDKLDPSLCLVILLLAIDIHCSGAVYLDSITWCRRSPLE
jgi:hypothetical protein